MLTFFKHAEAEAICEFDIHEDQLWNWVLVQPADCFLYTGSTAATWMAGSMEASDFTSFSAAGFSSSTMMTVISGDFENR